MQRVNLDITDTTRHDFEHQLHILNSYQTSNTIDISEEDVCDADIYDCPPSAGEAGKGSQLP